MKINWNKFNRKIHYWGSCICALPVIIIIATGLLLIFKKQSDWVQPPTIRGENKIPTISFDQVLTVAKSVPEAKIESWKNIDRLDVRPKKGVIKIRAKNRIEIQIDQQSGKILNVAYRRSDLIEAIHDGSFFHDIVKYLLFFPSSIILLILWITGLYLFIIPLIKKKRKKQKKLKKADLLTN